MKEVVEAYEFAELGEDLDKSVSGARRKPLWVGAPLEGGRRYALIHGWMKIADV
jgi:hypothetical protein